METGQRTAADFSSRTATDLMQMLAHALRIHTGNGHLIGGEPLDNPEWIPLCRTPDQFIIVVGGGVGRHSMYIPTFGASHAVTREIVF